MKPSHVFATLCIAACGQDETLLRVEVTADAAWDLDHYEVRLSSAMAQPEALPMIDVEVPDALAGQTGVLEVWGLVAGQQVAFGMTRVDPALHVETDVDVTLAALGDRKSVV